MMLRTECHPLVMQHDWAPQGQDRTARHITPQEMDHTECLSTPDTSQQQHMQARIPWLQ